jgi:hypothetical protein
MDLEQKVQPRHTIIRRVWDFFEDVPFWRMKPRQDLVDNGFCLAEPGRCYLVYLERPGRVNVLVEDGPYQVRWIDARDTEHVHAGGVTDARRPLACPEGGDDWLLSLTLVEAGTGPDETAKVVGEGTFPDIQVDGKGDLHLVYGRDNCVYYRRYDAREGQWGAERFTGIAAVPWMARSEPDIVVDSENNPHVFAGSEYARLDGDTWQRLRLGEKLRDTELAIDASDNLYLVHRGGNNGGYMGLRALSRGAEAWASLTDPDKPLLGRNDHVYPDLAVSPVDQSLHIAYRHGDPKRTAYRRSNDGGRTWPVREGITDNEPEAAHVVVDHENNVYVTDGGGNFFCRKNGQWIRRGWPVIAPHRGQPELAVDRKANVYCACWGGWYNVHVEGRWTGRRRLCPVTPQAVIGFVEPIGAEDFAYVAWEEGTSGDPGEGMAPGGVVVVGRLFPDGTVRGL